MGNHRANTSTGLGSDVLFQNMVHEMEDSGPTMGRGAVTSDGCLERYPLTSLQSGMLFHQLRGHGDAGVDLEQIVCQTIESIDHDAFTSALTTLFEWHPVLRTRFVWDTAGEPYQQIVRDAVPTVRFVDGRMIATEERTSDFATRLRSDRREALDLGTAPLIRATVVQYADDDARLLLTLHHAIVDGRCFPILLDDLFDLYAAYAQGRAIALPVSRVAFREFAEWTAARDFAAQSQSYWQNLLKGFSAPTPLMVDGLPDCGRDPLSLQEEITLSATDTRALEVLAASTGVTLHTVVQAAWALLLSRYASEADVVFGGTRACRKSSLPGVEDAIGLFINTLPVRAHVDPDTSLEPLLRELRQQWVDMREHEHTPLSRVQAWSDVEKGQSLFQSILVFENFDLDELMRARGGDWTHRRVELYEKTNFPITVAAYHGHQLRLKIEFEQQQFSVATIQRMLGHLRCLLGQFAAQPAALLRDFRLVTANELRELHATWATPVSFAIPGTITQWFAAQVTSTPDRVALSFNTESWTYAQLNAAANRVAHALITTQGVRRGDLVGMCVERSAETVIGILAVLKAGAAYVPIDLAYPADRLRWMLKDSAATVLLTQAHLVARLPDTQAAIVTFESIALDETLSHGDPDVDGDPDDLAYVIFTSGSTGTPKGCRVTHRNVARLMTATEPYYHFNETDVWTLFHSFAFDFSVWEIWGALLYGGRVVVVPYDTTRSPDDFFALLVRERVTVLNQTPSAFRQLIAAESRLGASRDALALRYVIFGGEALELESLRPWFDRHGDTTPQLINMYGITETTVHVTYRPVGKDDLALGSVIGKQIPDLEIHLLDPRGHPVPLGVPGEIYVGGAGVTAGYLNRPELTAARFLPHPSRPQGTLYRTGDVARFLPGDDLEYLGRSDDQVKIRGFRIELGEIQSVLTRHAAVREAFVTVDGTGTDKRIVAYLVGDQHAGTVSTLRAFAGELLPPYMIPSAMVYVDRFPLTNNGKIDRKALPKPDEVRAQRVTEVQPPQGDTEVLLSSIWARVLKLPQVGRDENYFELGGDSILSIQIVSQARRAGVMLTPRDLFTHQTIQQLAAAAGTRVEQAVVRRDLIAGPAPLTPMQRWFFAHELPNPHHWTQAFLFNLGEPLDVPRLQRALAGLVQHHAALRTAVRGGMQEVQESSRIAFWRVEGAVNDAELRDHCLAALRVLNIDDGQMVSAVYFDHATQTRPSQLFLAIHHLAVDGVSWRILLEDLEALYFGKRVEPEVTPFVNWAHHLVSLASDSAIQSQRSYWEQQAKPFRLLPRAATVVTTAGETESITVRLTALETDRLTNDCLPSLRAQLEEVLVASVAGAIATVTGHHDIAIDLEGHGRRDSAAFDLSRTVGWFTTIYPLALQVAEGASMPQLIAATKRAMRAVPDRGFAFGLLQLDDPGRDVLFNFLGRFDQVTSESALFSFASENSGSWYDAASSRSHLLEINSWIKDGCLEFTWTFAAIPRATVEAMARECVATLTQLVHDDHTTDAWIAADFPLASLRDRDVNTLGPDVDDVLPLTALQQLYYTLETARPGSGIDQWHWTLTGVVDPTALRDAWEYAVHLHAALRTSFVGAGLKEAVQIVRSHCPVPLQVMYAADAAEFDTILRTDRVAGLRIDDAPLMRLTLVEMPDANARLIWTHHHLQIDGWSWPIVLAQVSAAYRALVNGQPVALKRGTSIRDYLQWYRHLDLRASRQFWTQHLLGVSDATPVSAQPRGAATFHEHSATLSAETNEQLLAFARQLRCTVNALIQSAWAILLGQQAGRDDVVFGAAFSGRPAELPGVETIVGAFVNNLPVRAQLESHATFASLAASLQAQAVELAEHQHLPLREIHQLSAVPLRSHLFESLVVFQNYSVDASVMQWSDTVAVRDFCAQVRTNYPLTLVVTPTSTSLRLDLVCQSGFFDDTHATRILEALCAVLQRVADSPALSIDACRECIALPQIAASARHHASRSAERHPPVTPLHKRIAAVWERAFGINDVGIDENFFDLGGHSLLLIQVHALLCRELNEELSVVDVFSNPTIRTLAAAIAPSDETASTRHIVATSRPQTASRDIAIVGMSGRFPGADNVGEFWRNLLGNVESIVDFSDDDLRAQGLKPEAMRAAGHYVQRRGQLSDPDQFDAAFFGMSPMEATATDPQQRLFLETAWSALEDAGYAPSRVNGRVGVFAGMSNNSFYEQYVQADDALRSRLGDLIVMMGNEKDYLATRTAYKLNLVGPALNIYTACSTSLVAVAEAIYALREGRCEMAIAGAVSITFPQNRGYYYEEGGITSPDGHCRPFDASAAGTVFSNGIGAVILKPLDRAIEDGDTIHAVVRGVGLNNDGSDKVSFTAPSVVGQAGAIREACEQAGVSPDSIGYVEAHGTATSLGDPIEFQALATAYREHSQRTQFCGLGSVKSNLGHLDAAAGMAGLIKATLALRDGVIPATLHFQRPHPALRIESSPFRVIARNETWTRDASAPRRAGVSSFGVGGTNAHVVLEEAPLAAASTPSARRHELIVLSAKSAQALSTKREELASFLEQHPDVTLADVAYTLATGRELFSHRFAMVAASIEEATAKLRTGDGEQRESAVTELPVAFLFPGQGAQFAGMGHQLYDSEPVFRTAIDRCADILLPLIAHDVRPLMCDDDAAAELLLNQTRFTQPALFVMSYALSQLWAKHGVSPAAMIGHSVGEYSAAFLAGSLTLDDALRLIATRGRLVNALPGGSMLSIRLSEHEVRALLPDGVEIAAVNSPVMTVVAGASATIAALAEQLSIANVPHRELRTSHAFHSVMMDPVIAPFRDEVAKVTFAAPTTRFVSNVTGTWVTAAMVESADYWAGHVRSTVRFADGVRCLAADRTYALLEVGPGRSCVTFARQSIEDAHDYPLLTSLPSDADSQPFLASVGALWAAGGRIDWNVYYGAEVRRRISLPTYPFQRKRYWPNAVTLTLPLAARQLELAPVVRTETIVVTPTPSPSPGAPAPTPAGSRRDNLVLELREQIQRLTGFDEVAENTSFLDLGLDSLLIGQAAVTLTRHFGTRITFKHLMDEHDSVNALATFLDATLDASRFQPAPTAVAPVAVSAPVRDGTLEDRVARLEATLLQLLPGAPRAIAAPRATSAADTPSGYDAGQLHRGGQTPMSFGPFRNVAAGAASTHALTSRQQAHLDELIRAYTARTSQSKAHIQQHRATLADPRAAAGFNKLWKEMAYPVVSTRSQGAYLWDLDGNRWIDVTHGFGLGFFGHRPDFVVSAVAEQLQSGFEIGPSSPLAGEVAAMLCEVSGKDRATFCDTGSEAVTAAIRVARTVSQRDKIAVFQGSYHGIFDEVLGRPVVKNGELVTAPIAPGITDDSLANVLILDYGNPESLVFIKKYAHDLAAVLVEPVQSRRPDLQPREFLTALRALTAEHDIALVFDEVVTGFRCHPRGAQAVFGIDADLVTYGKVMGGGMPIGALAGRKKYMDALDGGAWNYGDDSGPEASVTFFAGTFVRHPLALAAARAVLTELKIRGGSLQENLDRRTEQMVSAMNAFADAAGVPVKVTRFSSMFMINFAPGLKYASLFFYHMRLRGMHLWETRPSFLSIAHTDDDVTAIIDAFQESIRALQSGGFFPGGDDGDSAPITPEQEELLVTSAMGDDYSRSFNESISIKFDGPLDRAALDSAIRAVVGRHESLRAVFERDGSAQRFVPLHNVDIRRTDVDLRGVSPEEVARYRDGAIATLFQLHNGPLVRFSLLQVSERVHELLIVSHHAVCDGWSFGVIYDDLLAHYRRAIGVAGDLPAVTPFREFVEQQRLPDVAQTRAEDSDYWVSRLASLPPTLRLPADVRDEVDAFECRATTRLLPSDVARAVLAFCKEARITPYTLFFAAYRDVLHRVSGQSSFCLGTPVASQASSGLPGLCGHGVHFLPLPCHAPVGMTISEYLADNRALILDSLDHQQTTLTRILRGLPDGQRLETVAATFTLETTSPAWEAEGIRVSLQVNAKRYSTFDLSLYATEDHGQFSLLANFRASKFSAERVDGWLTLMIEWLSAVVRTPGSTALADLPLALIDAPQPIGATYDVVSLFDEQVRRTPTRIALRWDGGQYSYDTVNRLANAVSQRLISAGVTPGSRVMLEVERSAELVIAILAILKCGAAYVPIDPGYPEEHRRTLREDTNPSFILDEDALQRLVQHLDPDKAVQAPRIAITPETLAYVMFTSGSTGRPKGVMIPHRGIARLVRNPGCIDIAESDVFLLAAPLSFDASTLEIWGALLNGACLAIPVRGMLTIHEIADCLQRYNVSMLWLTSGLFQTMIDERSESLARLRVLLAGGDVLSPRHVEMALDLLPNTRLCNGYGPTENTTFTTVHTITRADLRRASIPIGKPVAGTTVYMLDERQRPLPVGIAGELYTGGAGLALGYLNRPELTTAAFVANPLRNPTSSTLYRTGDRCRALPDGSIEFLGRIDRQVKVRGFRIELGEIESVMQAQAGVTGCRVVVQGDDAFGKSLVAFCTGDANVSAAVAERVQRTLPKHMHPSAIQFVADFPLSSNGKVDARALLTQLQSGTSVAVPNDTYLPPVTDTEKALHRIWSELLGRNHLGVNDTFFALGGHSLLGLRLFSRLETEFAFVSPLAVLFEHPTIRTLAAEIDRKSAPVESTAAAGTPVAIAQVSTSPKGFLAVLRKEGSQPPLFLIHGGDGGILFYRSLVPRLGALDCPIYAIESPSLNRRELDVTDFDALVNGYLQMIRSAQPDGPYHIGGYSFGGIVAFEIASRLQTMHCETKLLIFDAANPVATEHTRHGLAKRLSVAWNRYHRESVLVRCSKVIGRFASRRLHERRSREKIARCSVAWKNGTLTDLQDRAFYLNELHQQLVVDYAPTTGVSSALLIKSSGEIEGADLPLDYGWGAWIPELETMFVPGDHFNVFAPAAVDVMAPKLLRYLA